MVRKSIDERFWEKVDRQGPDDCWLWTAAGLTSRGYGIFRANHKGIGAHRWLYEQTYGPLPEGAVLHHRCETRACVNPAHLEPTTSRDNVLRGNGTSAANARKTHCKRGHPLSGDNLYIDATGRRHCRECRRAWGRAAAVREGRKPANHLRTHCPQGHPYEGDNLYVDPSGRRNCRACQREKTRRRYVAKSKGLGLPASRTHCPQGHPLSGDNLYITPRGGRQCRECKRESTRRWRAQARD